MTEDAVSRNEYEPDCVSPPGDSLREVLGSLGMSQTEFAKRTGRPKKTINEIIKGRTAITPDTALQFERVLGVPASFWNNRERIYQEALARVEENGRLEKGLGWLKRFPVAAMARETWIQHFTDKVAQLRELLGFFGVASVDGLRRRLGDVAQFRRPARLNSDPGALTAWLRKGELEAREIDCEPHDRRRFKDTLSEIRKLTVELPQVFVPEMVQKSAQAGVAVVFVPELPKTRVFGATRWLTPENALIQFSLRRKSDDQLWFTFFHEAGHILKHGKRSRFIENGRRGGGGEEETQADRFAEDSLIPRNQLVRFMRMGNRSKADIRQFAAKLGISPGIVVGRLQYERYIPHSHCNDLKTRLEWVKD